MVTESDKIYTENVIDVDISKALKQIDSLKRASIKAAEEMRKAYAKTYKTAGQVFGDSSSSPEAIFAALSGKKGGALFKTFRSDLSKLNTALSGTVGLIEQVRQKAAGIRLNTSQLGQKNFEANQYWKTQRYTENVKSYQLALQGVDKDTQKWVKRLTILDNTLGVTQLKLIANYAAINSLTSGFKYLLNYTVQYDKELRQLQAIANISDVSLGSLEKTIGQVAASTKFTTLELAEASTTLAQAGLSVTQISGTLPAIAKLATATGTDLATSTDVVTSTLNIYTLQTAEATNVTNSLTTAMNESKADIKGFQQGIQYAGNLAAQLGMSYEETAAAIAAATQAGIKSRSMLGTGLRAVLTEFLKPTQKLIDQLAKVGLTVNDIDVRSKGFVGVLSTLKEAGFGAAEAFRGMERRGAAFLAALLNQTDFMDDLRMKMVSSTAADKANEIQMKSLANTYDNFRSILGEATYQGMEPFIKAIQKLLTVVNNVLSSDAGSVFSKWLFGTIGTTATIVFLTTIVGSLKGIVSAFSMLGSTVKKMKGLESIGTIFSLIAGGKGLAITAAISALVSGGYMLLKWMGAFDSAIDNASAKLDEAKGKVQAEAEGYNTLNRLTIEFYANRSKLDSQAERNIFVSKLMSTLPEAAKMFKNVEVSVEELREALNKLNDIKLDNLKKEYESLVRASQSKTKAEMKQLSRGSVTSATKSLENLLGSDVISSKQINSLIEKSFLTNWGASSGEALRMRQEYLVSSLKNYANKTDDPASFYRTLAARPELKDIKDLLDSLADSVDRLEEATTNLIKGEIENRFNADSLKIFSSSNDLLKEAADQIRELRIGVEGSNGEITSEQYAQASGLMNKLTNNQDLISLLGKVKTVDDLARALGLNKTDLEQRLSSIKSIVPEARNMPESELVSLIGRSMIEQSGLLEVNSRLTDAIDELNSAIGGEGVKGASSLAKTLSRQVNSDIALLKGKNQEERASSITGIKDLILEAYKMSLAAQGIRDTRILGKNTEEALGIIPNALTADDLKGKNPTQQMIWNAAIGNLVSQLEKLKQTQDLIVNAIDKTALKTDHFFKNLKARIKEIEDAYNEGLRTLQKPITRQEGIVQGTERAYGSNSLIAQFQNLRLSKMQEDSIFGQLSLDKQALAKYRAMLAMLQANPLYNDYQRQYYAAEDRYNKAMSSGNALEMEASAKLLSSISDNYYKFTNQETKLNETIRELETTIEKNTIAIEEEAKAREVSTAGRFGLGTKAAISSYMNDQRVGGYMDFTGQWGQFSLETINSTESALQNFFYTISQGSTTAGEAFKSFGRTVLDTMAQIAAQMVAKNLLMTLFSAFAGGGITESSGGSYSYSAGGSSGGGSWGGNFAVGGLVKGPIKNRDSVPTMLMPGEYVMKKSAVDTLGRGFLDNLNNNSSQLVQKQEGQISASTEGEQNKNGAAAGVVNVYVVSDKNQAGMTPNDVIVTINDDLRKGGSTKQLVKQIAMGRI